MEWKAALSKIYRAVKPTTVSAEDQEWADKEERAEALRKKKTKKEGEAAAKYLAEKDKTTWSPLERNKKMHKLSTDED